MKHLPVFVIAVGIFFSLTGIFSVWLKNHQPPTLLSLQKEPLKSANIAPPEVTARHVLIKDLTTGEILYSKEADIAVAPASTTKMMTALVSVSDYGWDKKITTQTGEKYTVEQLIYMLLLKSDNNVAEILAVAHPAGRAGFVADMNTKAVELGLTSTVFKNPSGLDEDQHLSSATDLTRLGEYLIKIPGFFRIVSTQTASIIDTASGSGKILANTNPLLGKIPGVLGIKTGFTDNAGQTLVSLVDRGDRKIIITVLGSIDREKDSEQLIDWVYHNFTWQ